MLPAHIAFIMDGNGRWAQARGLPRTHGHKQGTRTAKKIIEACRELAVPYVTLYAFSTENWARPRQEVHFLFDLLVEFLSSELHSLITQEICIHTIGDITALPKTVQQAITHCKKQTAHNTAMHLNLALNYSSRNEIVRAVQKLITQGISPQDITEHTIADALDTAGQPDPDYIIRTSGELRLSNYLLYQAAYAELYFTDTLWPDFDVPALHKALEEFTHRIRRFGKTAEQLQSEQGHTNQ